MFLGLFNAQTHSRSQRLRTKQNFVCEFFYSPYANQLSQIYVIYVHRVSISGFVLSYFWRAKPLMFVFSLYMTDAPFCSIEVRTSVFKDVC